ncbi:divergent polysaccharide deacetylase family protein [Paenibacillus sp. CMAA1364]
MVINIGSAKAEGEGAVQNQSKPKVAIIIDDFGNGQNGTEEIFNMPIKLTIAIMPFLPTSRRDAELAHQKGFDVIVHMPMQPKHGKASWLGPGAITSELSDTEVRKRVNAAIDDIPYAIGMNNHMGSLITGDERIMSVVMQVCLERGLFYVDSSTNYRSIVGKLARQMGMPPVVNHLFLDDIHTNSHINKQLQAVESWGKEHQYCVTIGHVSSNGDITAKVLRTRIPQMKNNVEFVGISDLVKEVWGWGPSSIAPLNN